VESASDNKRFNWCQFVPLSSHIYFKRD